MSPPAALPGHVRRILVMRYRFIGDTLLAVPFLRNLRAAYPDAEIDMLVGPGSGEILRDCPYISRLIVFDTTRKHRYENTGEQMPRSFWGYVRDLRRQQYDMAFVLKRSFSSAALAWLAGIPTRIGFDTEGRGILLTHRVPYHPAQPEADSFLSLLEAVGLPATDRHLEAWWRDADAATAREALAPYMTPYLSNKTGKNLLLHLTASNPGKAWPLRHGIQLAEDLLATPGLTLHALGTREDEETYDELKAALPEPLAARVIPWCGQFTLTESLAFLSLLDGAVGVDSGTMHMAAACGIPVVALFGPMDDRKWAPPGATVVKTKLDCQPCGLKRPCPYDFECMQSLAPQRVLTACQPLLTQ